MAHHLLGRNVRVVSHVFVRWRAAAFVGQLEGFVLVRRHLVIGHLNVIIDVDHLLSDVHQSAS